MTTELKVGIDDCGSGQFRGYTCVVLRKAAVPELSQQGQGLLQDAGLKRFHGKDFNPADSRQAIGYERFLALIGDFMVNHQGYAAFCLSDFKSRQDYESAVERIAENVVRERSGHSSPRFIPDKAPVIDWFCRGVAPRLPHCRPIQIDVQVDKAQVTEDAQSQELIGICGSQAAYLLEAREALALIGNGLLTHAGAPWVNFGEVAFVDPLDSILTQAADVLSNFGMMHMRVKLRGEAKSARERAGSKMFRSVFGDEPLPPGHQLAVDPVENILTGKMSQELWLRSQPE